MFQKIKSTLSIIIFTLTLLSSEVDGSVSLIRETKIKKNKVLFHLSPDFSKKYVRQPLTLTYPEEVDLESLPRSVVEIPLITNVIAVIWLSGEKYTIDEMDEELFRSLVKIKTFFKRFFYNTSWSGELVPDRLIRNNLTRGKSESAALFTGGLDSTTTVFRHLDESLALLSFNTPHDEAVRFAQAHHLDFHIININYQDFLKLTSLDKTSCDINKWFWDTSMGLSWVGAAAPLLYTLGIPSLYIPSGFTWDSFIFSDGQTMRQPACPLIDENLSPMGLKVYHDIFTMTRSDKIKFISTFCSESNVIKPNLVVCNHHKRGDTRYRPCSKCVKCIITMLDILAIGENLKDYGFTLSDEEFILQFKSYIANLKMRRGGTYTALHDTQSYLKGNIEQLPQKHRIFYEWFINVDLWALVDEPPNRPLRTAPFRWEDYQDLSPTK